jgi:hypothetical protein
MVSRLRLRRESPHQPPPRPRKTHWDLLMRFATAGWHHRAPSNYARSPLKGPVLVAQALLASQRPPGRGRRTPFTHPCAGARLAMYLPAFRDILRDSGGVV